MNEGWLEKNSVYRYDWREGMAIFYSPIARRYVVASDEQFNSFLSNGHYVDVFRPLIDYVPIDQQKKVHSPAEYTLLTVLPNNVCNFSCNYCYSASGRNGSYLKEYQLYAAIKYFISSKPDDFRGTLTISYMGGGEPMLSWALLVKGILYAEEQAVVRGFHVNHRVITNGSILNDSILAFLKEHSVDVSVSFEIIRDIQNLQRQKYEVVERNIRSLIDGGVDIQINATITPANVGEMEMMLDCLINDYNQVRSAMFEPVTGQQLFSSPEMMEQFYSLYTEQFMRCIRRADKEGISLTSFAFLRTIYPLERACPGELCLTADGQITGCYCVSSPVETLFGQTCYGLIDDSGKIQFDMIRYNKLKAHDVYERNECRDCKVKWNCGGGCYYQYASYSNPYRQVVCNFTRSFVEKAIHYKVEHRLYSKVNFPVLLKE